MSSTGTVPFGQKVAFGLGMLANQMFPAAVGIFMVILVRDLGFPPHLWGILYFLPRVFDSITDPIMGFISDNTRSKWGRRRHYVFIGAIILGISFIAMWQLYAHNSLSYNFYYFLIVSIIFYLGLTIFSVPYVAMGYEMSTDFHERTNIMAVAQWIGQWAWVIAPWFWVVLYRPEWFATPEAGCRQLSIYVGIGCMILAMIPAIFIKSESTVDRDDFAPLSMKSIGNSLKEILIGFKEAFINVPFRRLCIATFFIYNSFNTIAAFSFFIIVYYLFNGDAAAAGVWPTLHGSLGAIATTFLVIPIVTWMSKRLGKRKTFLISQAISIIGYLLFWFMFIVDQYPGTKYAQSAMRELLTLEEYADNDYAALKTYYQTNTTIQSDAILTALASKLANECDIILENYSAAVSYYEGVIQDPADTQDSIYAIIDLGFLYQTMDTTSKAFFTGKMPQYKPKSVKQFNKDKHRLLSMLPVAKEAQTGTRDYRSDTYRDFTIRPNPVKSTALLCFTLIKDGSVCFEIHNAEGVLLESLSKGYHQTGQHEIQYNASKLKPGLYYCSLVVNGEVMKTRKMVVVR